MILCFASSADMLEYATAGFKPPAGPKLVAPDSAPEAPRALFLKLNCLYVLVTDFMHSDVVAQLPDPAIEFKVVCLFDREHVLDTVSVLEFVGKLEESFQVPRI